MDQSSEIFDVVDEDDRVIGQAERKKVHEEGLLHRSVHIMVFNSNGELFLQKRSMKKDENPGLWETSASGHVNAGEDYSESAQRELEEELGISAELEHFFTIKACRETLWEHVKVYKCVTDKKIKIDPEEISEGRFLTLEETRNSLDETPEKFTSSFNLIFYNYLKNNE